MNEYTLTLTFRLRDDEEASEANIAAQWFRDHVLAVAEKRSVDVTRHELKRDGERL